MVGSYTRPKTVTHRSTNRLIVRRPRIEVRTHDKVRRPNHSTRIPFQLMLCVSRLSVCDLNVSWLKA